MVRSLNGKTDFFDIIAGVLRRDTLAPYLPGLRASSVNTSNKNCSTLKRQEADNIPQKLWQIQTTQMI